MQFVIGTNACRCCYDMQTFDMMKCIKGLGPSPGLLPLMLPVHIPAMIKAT